MHADKFHQLRQSRNDGYLGSTEKYVNIREEISVDLVGLKVQPLLSWPGGDIAENGSLTANLTQDYQAN